MPLDLIITNAGRAALLNAQQTGTDAVTIAQAGLSASAISAAPSMTALPGEIGRVSTIGGTATASDVIHVSIRDESAAAYTLRSFALYLDDGTLFALYGQADPILFKTAASTALIAVDCVFADVSSASLVFGATNFTDPDATTARKGLIEIATTAEALVGTDGFRAITPAALAAALLPLLLARDGAGSGIDGDLLDGQQGSWYADIAARLGFTPANRAGDTFTGPVLVQGAEGRMSVRSTGNGRKADLRMQSDGNFVLYLNHGGADAAIFGIASTAGPLIFNVPLQVGSNPIYHAGNDGSGSGVDADLLDGQQGSWYADIAARLGFTPVNRAGDTMTGHLALVGDPTSAAHAARKAYVDGLTTGASMLARLLSVDGPGSGLDADLLDGQHASAFVTLAAFTGAEVLTRLLSVDGSGSGLDADLWRGKTPAQTIADFFSTGSNSNGRWWKMPDGAGGTVIEQQGRGAATSGQQIVNIVFPTAFQSTDYDLQLTPIIPSGGDYDNFVQEVDGTRTVNGVTVYAQDPSSGGAGNLSGFRWRAKGY